MLDVNPRVPDGYKRNLGRFIF